MRMLWVSNAPWVASGYGQQTALFAPMVQASGWDVAIANNFGMSGAASSWRGIPVLPTGYEQYSNDLIPSHAADWLAGDWLAEGPGDGWIFTLFDCYTFKNPRYQRFNVASWCPVDHLPVPPGVVHWFTEHNAVPIAMSKFGEAQLQRAGLDCLYVPHGIDTDVFTPGDQREAREVLGLPADAFVVAMNAANKGTQIVRKSFVESFLAFSAFCRERDDAVLYMHTEQQGFAAGVNLMELADAVGIPEGRLFWVDQYRYRMGLPESLMAATYRASDALLAPSKGEGFGIPVVEAQACGTRVIVSDFSAQPELVGDGWTVSGELDYDFAQHAMVFRPSAASIFDRLMVAHDERLGAGSPVARAFAEGYDYRRVWAEHFAPALEVLKARTPTLEPISVGSLA